MKGGRPLRFLAMTLGGWAAARVLVLWPVPDVREIAAAPRAGRFPAPVAKPLTEAGKTAPLHALSQLAVETRQSEIDRLEIVSTFPALGQNKARSAAAFAIAAKAAEPTRSVDAEEPKTAEPQPLLAAALIANPLPLKALRSRLRGATWLIARPAAGDNLAFGQLGGSQAGARLTYAVDRARSLAVSARLSAPLAGRGREAALGIDWRPTPLPIHVLVEQRIPLDGGEPRPAAQLVASLTTRLPLDLTLDLYGQAGAVHRRGGFGDGAARLSRRLFASRLASLDLGAGSWGAAQRNVARLDVGPTVGLSLPAQGGSVRLGVDYRFRIAGRASPGSGPALTLGTSF